MKYFYILSLLLVFISCNNSYKQAHTNNLISESSPYLLQHAHNPVNWYAWNKETLALAKKQNKPLIISIGYASCHWCHVMEKESFENKEVADFMNANFINIKVDREERPDIDKVYMNALQLMTGNGGWPMNIIALPNGKPFWGGTYYEKDNWLNILKQLNNAFKNNFDKVNQNANNIEKGLQDIEKIVIDDNDMFSLDTIKKLVSKSTKNYDFEYGGTKTANKYMNPSNLLFLMRYADQNKDERLLKYVKTTLNKMMYGGIYDQIEGGFSRYAVDKKWHIPHFEKMLYDNGQLVSLYADAYTLFKNDEYKTVVEETISFIENNLMAKNGAFYSSLDADSMNNKNQLEEGAYYTWRKDELKNILKDEFDFFADYYNINEYGFWEKDNYVLIRNKSNQEIQKKYNLSEKQLQNKLKPIKATLSNAKSVRDKPKLDDKSLTSWNALTLKGFIDAYKATNIEKYKDIALNNANFIIKNQLKKDGSLYHSYKDNKSSVNGYLEDYAATVNSFLSLYEITADNSWLNYSKDLTNHVFNHFLDTNSGLFYFTSNIDDDLVVRNIEKSDSAIPSSNSIMLENLYLLSHYFADKKYKNAADKMVLAIQSEIKLYPSSYFNWLNTFLNYTGNFYEIAITGNQALSFSKEFQKDYHPNVLFAISKEDSNDYLLENRFIEDETVIYVCVNNSCKLPVNSVAKAKRLIQ